MGIQKFKVGDCTITRQIVMTSDPGELRKVFELYSNGLESVSVTTKRSADIKVSHRVPRFQKKGAFVQWRRSRCQVVGYMIEDCESPGLPNIKVLCFLID